MWGKRHTQAAATAKAKENKSTTKESSIRELQFPSQAWLSSHLNPTGSHRTADNPLSSLVDEPGAPGLEKRATDT